MIYLHSIFAKWLAIRREIRILFPNHDLMTWQSQPICRCRCNQNQNQNPPRLVKHQITRVYSSCWHICMLLWAKMAKSNAWKLPSDTVSDCLALLYVFHRFPVLWISKVAKSSKSSKSQVRLVRLWTHPVGSRSKSSTGCRSGHQGRLYGLENQEMQEGWSRKFVASWIPKIEWMKKNVTITYYNSITTSLVSESNPLRWLQAACMQHWQEALTYRSTPSKKGGSLEARCGLRQFKIWV